MRKVLKINGLCNTKKKSIIPAINKKTRDNQNESHLACYLIRL